MAHKKLIGLLMAAAVFSSSAVWAMDARKEVLGADMVVGENQSAGLVLDSADSFVNPAYMLDYTSLLGLEGTAGANDLFTGFVFVDMDKLGLPGALGIQVGRNFGMLKRSTLTQTGNINALNAQLAPALSQLNSPIDGNPTLTDLTDVRSWGFLYGLSLGEDLSAGLAFNSIGNGIKGKETPGVPASADMSKSITDMEIRLGAKMGLGSNMSAALDLGLNFPTFAFSYNSPALIQKADMSAFNLDINARLAMALNKSVDAVALVGYANYGGKTTVDPDASISADNFSYTLGRNDLYIGVGALLHDQDSMAGLLLGFMSRGYAEEVETQVTANNTKTNPSLTYFPSLKLLAERNLAKWFALRGSVSFTHEGTSTSNLVAGATYTTNDIARSYIATAIGASLNFDAAVIETVISKTLLFNGPFTVGGVVNTGLNASLSIGYKF